MQIRQYIVDNIQQKKWKPDDKIPSENELAEKFKVSRITVKKALDSLVEEGIIYRIQGRGSFVAKEKDSQNLIYQNKMSQRNMNKLIACIIPRLNSQFITIMVGEIEKLLSQYGYRMILCQTYDSQQLETQILKEVLRLGVDGIMIYPAEGETYNEEILKLTIEKFPLVLIDRYFRGIGANSVCTDNILGAYEATIHLLELGHSKIGIISSIPDGTTSVEDRIKGFEKALTEHNVPIDHHLYLLDLTFEEHNNTNKDKIWDFLSNHRDVSALFVVNNGLTVMEVALEMGFTIPQDLSIIMFDDYEFSHLLKVPPTCMRQQEKLLGQEAVKLIISTIENPLQKRQQIFIPPKLIVRNSTTLCKTGANQQVN
ncbi:GntR family transcriptional regulator [Geobacillus sp. 46C-IIa]|uniref:GntR family transcriptional regulator n=1 Tax=Geobacillus sp. 46C-IIa TaxID=1963025 RepID=UPI0009C01C41|nr:GntR family transcriptional regulator [Geobacillus sp. 46C-IIa]OQP06170.1 GntR family transcriptional regulator [Geobacillus sp. 46C-IIa]QNU29315.1 GntR family transcriptional regulator [Geobacillus sp. 46C-IIa]